MSPTGASVAQTRNQATILTKEINQLQDWSLISFEALTPYAADLDLFKDWGE